MNIHEYQAKRILDKYGVPVLKGFSATSVEEALSSAKKLNSPITVVKAQIHAGGRGAGHFEGTSNGGVRIANSADEIEEFTNGMLGHTLITKQTGEVGKTVECLYLESGCNIEREFYLSILIDRNTNSISLVVSAEGGMDIEEVANSNPEKIFTIVTNISVGIMPYHVRRVLIAFGLDLALYKQMYPVLNGLYKAFIDTDASLIEINPLVLTKENDLIALDCKMGFDDNALWRHKEIQSLRDPNEQDSTEIEALQNDLSYLKLDGEIGCMVNGAGLAMATMDIIQLKGSSPANFLDVGGGATKEKITTAFKILCRDSNVKGILINIFGGIMRCDIVANGIVAAAKELKLTNTPIVVRLEGTNVEKGRIIMNESGISIISATDLDDAATKIVAACKDKK